MEQLTFTDGFTALFLVQSLIVGALLVADIPAQNRYLGVFVIVYAVNSSRVLLYKLSTESPFLDFYVGISWAGFFIPLLYFFLLSHIRELSKKSIIYHCIFPSLMTLFSIAYIANSDLQEICGSNGYNLISYGALTVLCILYGFLIFHTIFQNPLWKEILRSVRLKILVFAIGLICYILFISVRILISIIFDLSSSPSDPLYQIQNFLFYLVFALIPIYAYTLLSRFKKYIQPRNVSTGNSFQSLGLKEELNRLFEEEGFHKNTDLNPNTLANILDIPIKDLRLFFKNHYNKTIPEFITQKRLEEFLLQAKDDSSNLYNIEGLALNAGFNSRPTFYRAFKKKYGVTPAEYLTDQ